MNVLMRSVAELIQRIEGGRHMRRVPVPVGDGDGSEHDVPALAGVPELAFQPAGWHYGVGVGGRQPGRRRIHPGRPCGADVASADGDDPGTARPRDGGGPVGAGIGDHQHRHRHADAAGDSVQSRQAGRQQRFLVVGRHDDADRLNARCALHTRPVAWATDTGAPSERM
jgi:hypothetical protein